MKKEVLLGMLFSLSSQALIAGEMGPMVDVNSKTTPFVTIEGQVVTEWAAALYSQPRLNSSYWGGRVAAGISHPYKKFRWTAETGWGDYGYLSANEYYEASGSTNNSTTYNPVYVKLDVSAPDLLVGLSYRYNKFDFFVKGGTLFTRSHLTVKTKNLEISSSTRKEVLWDPDITLPVTDILPELKVGVSYDINRNISGFFSFMHAFGSMPRFTGSNFINTVNDVKYVHNKYDIKATTPFLDVFSLGLKYSFEDA